MKRTMTIFGFLLMSFSSQAVPRLIPIETQYCSSLGSRMTIKQDSHHQIVLTLQKNGDTFTFVANLGTVALGGPLDIQDLEELVKSRNLVPNDSSMTSFKSFAFSTLLSEESTIQANNTLKEGTLSSGDSVGVLESNGTNVFAGTKGACK